jgi:hypothetical protein
LVIDAIGSTAPRVLAEQHLVGVLVDDQRHAGLQVERIVAVMQAQHLADAGAGRHHRLQRHTPHLPCTHGHRPLLPAGLGRRWRRAAPGWPCQPLMH